MELEERAEAVVALVVEAVLGGHSIHMKRAEVRLWHTLHHSKQHSVTYCALSNHPGVQKEGLEQTQQHGMLDHCCMH